MDTLLKKTMTKKAYEAAVRKNRSIVSRGMNLGTRTMKSAKDRREQKTQVLRMLRMGAWE